MRYSLLLLLLVVALRPALAQSQTTETLDKKYSDGLSLFFYNNTLRMLNQSGDKDFDALIKDIEKMKFLMFEKGKNFSKTEYAGIISKYKSETFEEVMSSRHQGKNFDVLIKEKNGATKGMLVLINDSTNIMVLDIVGRIALDKVTKLYSTIDQSADIGNRIKNFNKKD